ncbi:MAG: dienelactone hydrolase family protein [Rhodospirillales bacterium]
MAGQEITIKAADGSGEFMAYLATPASGSGPGIVAIQEIFGVNYGMREISDWLAGEGFVVLCPDLFWRQEPGIQLTDKTEAEWARAFELFNGFNLDKGMEDIASTISAMRGLDACTGKVGTIGYCLGGRLAMASATRTDADAAVGYYGVMLPEHANETVRCPVMLHIAEKDEFVPAEQQAEIREIWGDNDLVTMHSYAGQNHAFARPDGIHYDKASAELANGRALAFLKEKLA